MIDPRRYPTVIPAPASAGAGYGRYPRLASVRQRQVVDTGLRRHDEVGSVRESIIPPPGMSRCMESPNRPHGFLTGRWLRRLVAQS
jgi:hypothetical protein